MKRIKTSRESAVIESWRYELTPEERKRLSAPKDAWDAMFNEETTWQIIKRKFRKFLRTIGVNWTKIPIIRGQWKHYNDVT